MADAAFKKGGQAEKGGKEVPTEAQKQTYQQLIREFRAATNKYNGFMDAKLNREDASKIWFLSSAVEGMEGRFEGLERPPTLDTKEIKDVVEKSRDLHEWAQGAPSAKGDINYRDFVWNEGRKYADNLRKFYDGEIKERPSVPTQEKLMQAYDKL